MVIGGGVELDEELDNVVVNVKVVPVVLDPVVELPVVLDPVVEEPVVELAVVLDPVVVLAGRQGRETTSP